MVIYCDSKLGLWDYKDVKENRSTFCGRGCVCVRQCVDAVRLELLKTKLYVCVCVRTCVWLYIVNLYIHMCVYNFQVHAISQTKC